ncbi:MAG: CDGSH iron-sulfur domain-containing protein [Myxococcales bacterium]|nr:CDGSH iron-sulfur domain-containing protein [Myxococcales bacterium]
MAERESADDVPDPPTLSARHRGPLVVEGRIRLFDTEGREIDISDRKRVLLCRCGASRTRPLCDGSHYRTNFEAEG